MGHPMERIHRGVASSSVKDLCNGTPLWQQLGTPNKYCGAWMSSLTRIYMKKQTVVTRVSDECVGARVTSDYTKKTAYFLPFGVWVSALSIRFWPRRGCPSPQRFVLGKGGWVTWLWGSYYSKHLFRVDSPKSFCNIFASQPTTPSLGAVGGRGGVDRKHWIYPWSNSWGKLPGDCSGVGPSRILSQSRIPS